MKATYGVMGMMEWIALIPAAHNTVRVRFSGGSMSGYGVTPATFTTTNPVVMEMIEKSEYFERGKIRLIRKENDSPTDTLRGVDEKKSDAQPSGVAGSEDATVPLFKKKKR